MMTNSIKVALRKIIRWLPIAVLLYLALLMLTHATLSLVTGTRSKAIIITEPQRLPGVIGLRPVRWGRYTAQYSYKVMILDGKNAGKTTNIVSTESTRHLSPGSPPHTKRIGSPEEGYISLRTPYIAKSWDDTNLVGGIILIGFISGLVYISRRIKRVP